MSYAEQVRKLQEQGAPFSAQAGVVGEGCLKCLFHLFLNFWVIVGSVWVARKVGLL